VADPLPIFIPVTNLQGVPYAIRAQGNSEAKHVMSLHADHVRFLLSWDKALLKDPEEGIVLDAEDPGSPGWKELCKVALASGAFPLVLKPRRLQAKVRAYEEREWTIAGEEPVDGSCQESSQIRPEWNKDKDDVIEFLAVDGGIMNNEPFELVRRALADGEAKKRNPRNGGKATRAVVMIDPVQESTSLKPPDKINVLGTALDMVLSLYAQAQFKVEELELAQKPDCYSRFLIAPVRRPNGPEKDPAEHPLATAGLSGFAGFLDKELRRHDYELGRYNCRRFLSKHFILPDDTLAGENALFCEWDTANQDIFDKEIFRVVRDNIEHLPVIPLVGEAAKAVKPPEIWPKVKEKRLADIRGRLLKRLDAVVPRLGRQLGLGRCGLLNIGIKLVWYVLGDAAVDELIDRVRAGLKDREQYEES
jgi:hypothetical protein